MDLKRIDGVHVVTAAPKEVFADNITRNSARDLPTIHDLPDWREGLPLALIGGGPSLSDHIGEARRYVNTMVCGSAHDYAVSQGVELKWAVCCDPDPVAALYYKNPQKNCTYLIASSCDNSVFEALNGHNVVLWHSGGHDLTESMWGTSRKVLIGGGCTVGTRAFMIGICFGFTNFHFFGFDGHLQNDRHHAYEYADGDDAGFGEVIEVKVGNPDNKSYKMAGYMLGQLFDFDKLIGQFGSRLTLTVHGEGPLYDLVEFGKAKENAEES